MIFVIANLYCLLILSLARGIWQWNWDCWVIHIAIASSKSGSICGVKVYHLYDLLFGHAVKLSVNMIYDFLRHLNIRKSTEKRKSTITFLSIFFVFYLSYFFFGFVFILHFCVMYLSYLFVASLGVSQLVNPSHQAKHFLPLTHENICDSLLAL